MKYRYSVLNFEEAYICLEGDAALFAMHVQLRSARAST